MKVFGWLKQAFSEALEKDRERKRIQYAHTEKLKEVMSPDELKRFNEWDKGIKVAGNALIGVVCIPPPVDLKEIERRLVVPKTNSPEP